MKNRICLHPLQYSCPCGSSPVSNRTRRTLPRGSVAFFISSTRSRPQCPALNTPPRCTRHDTTRHDTPQSHATWTDTRQGEDYALGSVADWVPPDGTVVQVRAVPEHRLPVWQRIILIGPLGNSLPFASLPSANRTSAPQVATCRVSRVASLALTLSAIGRFGGHVTLQWCAIFSVRCAICAMARPFAFRSRAHAIPTACTRM